MKKMLFLAIVASLAFTSTMTRAQNVDSLQAVKDSIRAQIKADRLTVSLYTWPDNFSTYAGEKPSLGRMVPPDEFFVERLGKWLPARQMLSVLYDDLRIAREAMTPAEYRHYYADGSDVSLEFCVKLLRERLMAKEQGIAHR